jgi:integrase
LAWQTQCKSGRYVIGLAGSTRQIDKDKANRLFWRPMRGSEWCINTKKNWFKIGFHTYRHSFASNLAAAGVDQRIIDEFMGHTTEAMRQLNKRLRAS